MGCKVGQGFKATYRPAAGVSTQQSLQRRLLFCCENTR